MSTGKVDYGEVYIIIGRRLLVNKTSIFAMYKVKKQNEKKVMFIFSTLYRVGTTNSHGCKTCLYIPLSEVYCGRLCYTTETMVQRIHRCKSVCIYIHRCAVLRPPLLVVVVLRNLAQRLYRVNTY